MARLTTPQMVALHRIYLGPEAEGFPAATLRGTKPERRLVDLGLVRCWDEVKRFGGGGALAALPVVFTFAELTVEGHELHHALGLPLAPRDVAFLSRRAGSCAMAYAPFVSGLARGFVAVTWVGKDSTQIGPEHPLLHYGTVGWKRTPAGRDARKGATLEEAA